ncbi:MAG: hypothetical protein AB1426_03925 [Bacillota bacterium]
MRVVAHDQVVLFLVEFKRLVWAGGFCLVRRRENLEAIARLGWSEDALTEFLCSLTPDNYVGGPEGDRDVPGEDLWFFGAEIEGCEFYIKLKIRRLGEEKGQALCLSFHPAQKGLVYPHRHAKHKVK